MQDLSVYHHKNDGFRVIVLGEVINYTIEDAPEIMIVYQMMDQHLFSYFVREKEAFMRAFEFDEIIKVKQEIQDASNKNRC